jgi:hypothetical protein
MVNYQQGKIYRLVCNTTGLVYVGSTCLPTLAKRLQNHKSCYKIFINGGKKEALTSFKILEHNNYDIILIENYPCNSKDELHQRERHFIETMECVNKVIPGRTKKEYFTEKKESINVKHKQWCEENKDRVKETQKQWREENKDKIKEVNKKYSKENELRIKENMTQYKKENPDKFRAYKKKYVETNKDKIREYHKKWREANKLKNQTTSSTVVAL